jgi:hypothetical protein
VEALCLCVSTVVTAMNSPADINSCNCFGSEIKFLAVVLFSDLLYLTHTCYLMGSIKQGFNLNSRNRFLSNYTKLNTERTMMASKGRTV